MELLSLVISENKKRMKCSNIFGGHKRRTAKNYDAVMGTLGITSGDLNEEKQRVYYRLLTVN